MKTIDYSVYRDRILACWTGKSLGGIIGAPYECHKQFKQAAVEQLWPKVLYPNDDLDIQVVYLEALQEKGLEITSFELAEYWMEHCFYVCCEYGIFADNFEHKIYPPYSGIWNNDWHQTSMGCPIRSEIWGILCAGNPALAAEYAAKDGCLDHGKESIEIEQFWSAAASLAFFETDLETLLDKSLAFVPAGSLADRIYRSTKMICSAENDVFSAWRKVIRQWGHRNATSAQTNFALTLMALLLGKNDFRKTMHVCVQSGWDADCTAATAGALLGLLHGTAVLPLEWCEKMGKTLVCACEIPHQFASLETFADETALLGVEMAGLKNREIRFSGAPAVTVRRREKPAMELRAEYLQTAALFFGKPTEVKLVFTGKYAAGKRLKLSVTGPAGLNIDFPSELAVSADGTAEAGVRISCPDSMQWMDSRNFFRASVSDETGKEAVCDFGLQGARQFSVYGPYWDMWDMKKYKVCPYDCEEQTCNPGNLPGFRDAMDMYVDLDKPYLDEAGLLAGPLPEEMSFAVEIGGNHLCSRDLGSFQGTCCYYLVRTIRSQADLDGVSCSLGSDVPAKMWIDGKEVFRQEQHLALVGSSNEKMMLDLRKGEEHRLVIKVAARADSFELRYGFLKGTETRKRAISPYVGSLSFRRGGAEMTELPQILPLLWLHGEPFPVLEEEIRAMHGAGLRGFILESRPFPDYLGPHWWETLHFVLGLAEQLGMKALIFDDSHFPSGYAGGIIAKEHPQYLRLLLAGKTRRFRMAERGEYSFDAQEFLADGDRKVLKLFFLPMTGEKTFSAVGKIVCEPDKGRVRLSAGEWLLLAAVVTRNGGENHTRNYINMISPVAVREYIRIIYERHVRELADHIGKSFFGFFSDEPRLANLPSYDAVIGVADMPLPYSEELDFDWELLPNLLFASDDPDADREIRVRFMDRVSRLYSESFPQQIGRFCREHGLVYIGHVIEDNGAHVRLGYGTGHYFRSQEGQTWAGVDTVLGQNRPGFTEGILPSVFGKYRSEFFHWGLMNLASSTGALRQMPSFCEIFGAYGWGEGLSRMKWHTDLAVVRGISRLVPHAFSPKECPDPDCPPHFYARGKNPQWPYFSRWVRYADQLCRFAGDGKNAASVGILYHAEAEWGNGTCIPCERIISALAKRQISSLIVPFDELENAEVSNGTVVIGDARITILAAGDFDRLPPRLRTGLLRLERAGIRLIRITGENLISEAEKLDSLRDIKTEKIIPFLRVLHLHNAEGDRYFLVNESLTETVDTVVSGLSGMKFHDPLREMDYRFDGKLFLLPGESIFLVPGSSDVPLPVPGEKTVLLKKETFSCLNGTLPPDFCGKAVYEREWQSEEEREMLLILPDQLEDVVVCSVNGEDSRTCFSSPFRFEVTLKKGPNRIRLEIVNTLYPLYGKNLFDEDCPGLLPGLRSDIILGACLFA